MRSDVADEQEVDQGGRVHTPHVRARGALSTSRVSRRAHNEWRQEAALWNCGTAEESLALWVTAGTR